MSGSPSLFISCILEQIVRGVAQLGFIEITLGLFCPDFQAAGVRGSFEVFMEDHDSDSRTRAKTVTIPMHNKRGCSILAICMEPTTIQKLIL